MAILIEEHVPKKVPGLSSFTLKFNYNQALVDCVKKIDGSQYTAKDKTWEIPVTGLQTFIDVATKVDDIQLKLLKDKPRSEQKFRLKKYKTDAFQHQKEAIQYGLNSERFLLLDAPGLGKTATLIHLAEELKSREGLKHCLIVCGINSLKSNWVKEIHKHSDLDAIVIGNKTTKTGKTVVTSIKERIEQLSKKIKEFFLIINIESLRDDNIIKLLNDGPNKVDMIVCDEVHKCKNSTSAQGKNFLKLTKAKHRIGATGTLLLNNPLDAYVPLKWIGVEKASYTNFRYYYCTYDGTFHNILMGYKNTGTLKHQLENYSLRRTKDLLDLPPKTIIKEVVEMDSVQQKFYEDVKAGIRDEVDKVKLTTANILALSARLRQATVSPSILSTSSIPSAKLDRCCELVEEIVSNGNKVVVFSVFKDPLYQLEKRLSEYKPLVGTGDLPDEVVSKNIDTFQTNPDHKVFLGTHSKMGTGVTLTAASYAIMLDQLWTPADNLQSEDRIYRIGTSKNVFIYYLITKDTIDEHVDEVVDDKSLIVDYVVDGTVPQKCVDRLRELIVDL